MSDIIIYGVCVLCGFGLGVVTTIFVFAWALSGVGPRF